MTRVDIEELIPLIPEDSGYVRNLRSEALPQARVEQHVKVLSHALNDPKFGWHFVVSWVRSGEPFPMEAIRHRNLSGAFSSLKHGWLDNQPVLSAIALEMPDSYCVRSVMRCALVAKGKQPRDIDRWLCLPAGTAQAYNDLFFNVLDRRNEPGYIATIVWPEGRLAELNENYLQSEDRATLMLRAAAVHGLDSALQMAGLSHQGTLDGVSGTTRLESSIMTNANRLADWGGLNQSHHLTGLHHGKAVLIAVRGAGETSLTEDELALHNINAVSPALDELRQHNGIKAAPRPNYKLGIEKAKADAAFAITNEKSVQEKSRRQLVA